MALFENFPYTNLHELNLDWIVKEINELKEGQVLSVNGQTGHVILYQAKDILFPAVPEDHWSMVRSADGTTRGIMFGNDGRAYIVHGNSMEQIYSLNHQPPYPVTSVNGQTGVVSLYTDNNGTIAFPTVTNPNIEGMIVGRSINGTPVYLQINTDGTADIVAGENGGEIYTTQNTDKNVFALEAAGSTETGTTNHDWGIVREVNSGNIGILFRLGETPEVYLRYQDEGFQVENLKLLTRDDIPSSSGVVSFNGETGVVTADGTTLKMGDGDNRFIADAIEDIIDDEYQMDNSMTYTERGNTATQNIPLGKYVIWKNHPYISIANISSGDTLSSSNLLPLDHGIVDNLLQTVNSQANQINTLNSNLISRTRPSENAISYTLKSGFSLESWGQINIRVIGGILLINVGGLKTDHNINVDEEFLTLTNFTFTNMGSAYGMVWIGNRDKPGNISVYSSKLWLNRIPADAVMSFQISVPIYV